MVKLGSPMPIIKINSFSIGQNILSINDVYVEAICCSADISPVVDLFNEIRTKHRVVIKGFFDPEYDIFSSFVRSVENQEIFFSIQTTNYYYYGTFYFRFIAKPISILGTLGEMTKFEWVLENDRFIKSVQIPLTSKNHSLLKEDQKVVNG